MILELANCKSFKSHIKVNTWSDTIDTHIGTKTEEGFDVTGYVSISIEEFKQAWQKAVDEAIDYIDLAAELEIDFCFEYENESFYIVDEYEIKNNRVVFRLEE